MVYISISHAQPIYIFLFHNGIHTHHESCSTVTCMFPITVDALFILFKLITEANILHGTTTRSRIFYLT